MKMKSMSKYFIRALGCLSLLMTLNAQEAETEVKDSIVVQEKYGMRLGADLSKIISAINVNRVELRVTIS